MVNFSYWKKSRHMASVHPNPSGAVMNFRLTSGNHIPQEQSDDYHICNTTGLIWTTNEPESYQKLGATKPLTLC